MTWISKANVGVAGGPRGWCEWRAFVDSTAVHVQAIAQHCAFRHQELRRGSVEHGVSGADGPTWQGEGRPAAAAGAAARARRESNERDERAEATVGD